MSDPASAPAPASTARLLAAFLLLGLIGGAFSLAVKYALSSPTGGACSEPDYCRGGLCVGATPRSTARDGYCSQPCAEDGVCPEGYVCGAIAVEQMGYAPREQRVCLRE